MSKKERIEGRGKEVKLKQDKKYVSPFSGGSRGNEDAFLILGEFLLRF